MLLQRLIFHWEQKQRFATLSKLPQCSFSHISCIYRDAGWPYCCFIANSKRGSLDFWNWLGAEEYQSQCIQLDSIQVVHIRSLYFTMEKGGGGKGEGEGRTDSKNLQRGKQRKLVEKRQEHKGQVGQHPGNIGEGNYHLWQWPEKDAVLRSRQRIQHEVSHCMAAVWIVTVY